MFASQLSRILQTLPADVNHETRTFDKTEEKTSMKENQLEIVCTNGSNEADPFSYGKKGAFDSNGIVADNDHLAYGTKDRDEFQKVSNALVDCSLDSIKNKFDEDLPVKDDHNVPFHFIAKRTVEDTLASDTKHSNRYSPEFESYMIVNSTDYKDQCVLSGATSASEDPLPCTDTSIIKHEMPKLVISLRRDGDENSDLKGGIDSESRVQDANIHVTNECTIKESEDIKLCVDNCTKLSSEVNINKDDANDTYLEDLVKLFGSKCSTSEKVVSDMPEKECFGDRSHNIHGVFPDQKPLEEEIMVGHTVISTMDESFQKLPNSEDKAKANHLIASQDQFVADGEASFSALGSIMGLITYSGPIPYSGSISHRSDSSTTSARSFAFPILQSEWNSSPIKMKKADKRYRKHRGWRQGLCCRF